MSELALNSESNWTEEACLAWIADFEARRQAYVDNGGAHGRFMEEQEGTFPREVMEFIWRESQGRGGFLKALKKSRATYFPARELARQFPGSKPINLIGVEVVNIDDPNRQT